MTDKKTKIFVEGIVKPSDIASKNKRSYIERRNLKTLIGIALMTGSTKPDINTYDKVYSELELIKDKIGDIPAELDNVVNLVQSPADKTTAYLYLATYIQSGMEFVQYYNVVHNSYYSFKELVNIVFYNYIKKEKNKRMLELVKEKHQYSLRYKKHKKDFYKSINTYLKTILK